MDARRSRLFVRLVANLAIASVLIFGGIGQVSAAGVIRYVKADAQGLNNGTSWANAYKNPHWALLAASAGDQIWVAKGTYKPPFGLPKPTRDCGFRLKQGVGLYGGFAGTEIGLWQRNPAANVTILSGDILTPGVATDNCYHVVVASSVDGATLDGFTITAGNANGTIATAPRDRGGGLYSIQSRLVMQDITFSYNAASSYGGGLYAENSNLTLYDATFSGNEAHSGGGLRAQDSVLALLTPTFNGNHANVGGGMATSPATTMMYRATFNGNSAHYGGGGMYSDGSSHTLDGATFNGNTADTGAGMYNYNTTATLSGMVFSNNKASADGGGMFNSGGYLTLTNVTFSGNAAGSSGAGIENLDSSPALTHVTLSGNKAGISGGAMSNVGAANPSIASSILWGNGTQEIANSSGAPVIKDTIVAGGCPSGSTCTHVLDANPRLGPLQYNYGFSKNMALGTGSAAIDAASEEAPCADQDQRGFRRPQDGNGDGTMVCDLGAYEAPTLLKLRSIAAHDGWVRESGENSNLGGTLDAAGPTLSVGDDAVRKQSRAILSFNTAGSYRYGPIVSLRLQLTRQSIVPTGSNPFNTLQGLMIDVRRGCLGTLPSLQGADFQAAGVTVAGPFKPAPAGAKYTIQLPVGIYDSINKDPLYCNGLTQMRLRFTLDDDNDALADYISFFSGNHATASNRPMLIIAYYYDPPPPPPMLGGASPQWSAAGSGATHVPGSLMLP